FKPNGDLPEGIHVSDWPEIETRFGKASEHRTRAYARLRHLYELASRTGRLARFIVFGSFVSATIAPRDIDVLLVMTADFRLEEAPRESRTLFSHAEAEARFSASVFWVREGMLPDQTMQMFIETWQTKRDGTKRRICGGQDMIRNDHELAVMRERVASLEKVLERLRKTARPEEWAALSSGYRLEIERMQGEILDYLVQGAPASPAESAV